MASKQKRDSAAAAAGSGESIAESIARIDDILAHAGMEHGKRTTRLGMTGLRRDEKTFKDWPRAGKIKRSSGIETVVAPTWNAKEIPWLRHGFSTRSGGCSIAYLEDGAASTGELNLSWTQEDDPASVAENRARFVAAIAGRRRKNTGGAHQTSGARLVTLRQIHSGLIHIVTGEDAASATVRRTDKDREPLLLSTADGRAVVRGDGMMTNVPGLLLGIQTADCVPVLLVDTRTKAVAAFHAGWKSTLARIVERGVGRMRLEYGSRPKDILASIGPSIGPCCYSIGEEVRHEFTSQFSYADTLFSEVYDRDPIREKYPMLFLTQRAPGHSDIGPQTHLDLWEANLRQLLAAGVKRKNITVMGECTACNSIRYFSHRAQHGFTGRMMNVVGVAG